MNTLIAIALGGAIGSLARHGLTLLGEHLLGTDFPYGIFAANVLGSLLIGMLFVLLVERSLASEVVRQLLMVGFLGAFTTFSTFSLHTITMIQDGRLLTAATYVLGSVVLSVLGAWLGLVATRQLTA